MNYNNLTKLLEINKEGILNILKERYEQDTIYTNIDDIVIAINPYKTLPIYDYKLYQKPHLFEIAQKTINNITDTGKNQTILISGFSGSGKTESCKYIINYFANHFSSNEKLCEQIINANPIIEVFGNAQTIMNDNSSRFGKFIKVYFNEHITEITGIQIDTYLLEKSRVCYQNEKDFNFHIFNQVAEYNKKTYKYCNRLYNYQKLEDTVQLMTNFGFSEKEVQNILNLIQLILEIGDYDGKKDVNWEKYIDLKDFKNVINSITINAGKEKIFKYLEGEELEKNKFTICTQLYEICFHYVIDKINSILNPNDTKTKFIGLLDIFGFEIFKNNNFEQLCINYTNEKLQNHHNFIIFKNEQELYKKESINWEIVEYKDNIEILDIFESKYGIINLLDEECTMTASSDDNFHRKMNNYIKLKPLEIKDYENKFIIHHYAGDVEYSCNKFCEKNKQKITKKLLKYLSQSNNLVLKHSYQKYTKNKSIIKSFSNELNILMNKIKKTNSLFVKCIKPNNEQVSDNLDPDLVFTQLLFSGVFEIIEISRMNYPIRYPIIDFYDKYNCIMDKIGLHNYTLKDIQFGNNIVFMRNNIYKQIKKQYIIYKNKCATKIQALWKKYHIRKHYLHLRECTIKLQAFGRMINQRRKYRQIRKKIIMIQTYWKMSVEKKKYIFEKKTAAAVKIQSHWRMCVLHNYYNELVIKTICLQRLWRQKKEREEEEKRRLEQKQLENITKDKVYWPKSNVDSPSVFYITPNDMIPEPDEKKVLVTDDEGDDDEIEELKIQYEEKIQTLEQKYKIQKIKKKIIKEKFKKKVKEYKETTNVLSMNLNKSQEANRMLVEKFNNMLIQNYQLQKKYEEEKRKGPFNKLMDFLFK